MKKYIAIIAIVLGVSTLNAQSIWNITYDVAVPLGDTKDFIESTSFRGFGIDGRSFINDNLTLGGSWNWSVFYESEKNVTVEEGVATINGNHYDYGNYMPFMFNTHYYFGEDGGTRPYIGTGVGPIWKEERKDIGAYNVLLDKNWQFGLTPEVGIFVPLGGTVLFFANAEYCYGFKTNKLTSTSYLKFGVGLAWENF